MTRELKKYLNIMNCQATNRNEHPMHTLLGGATVHYLIVLFTVYGTVELLGLESDRGT